MIYSPSQTRSWATCRFKWFLEQYIGAKWALIGKAELAAAVGTAVGGALSAFYSGSQNGVKWRVEELIELAREQYRQHLDKLKASGLEMLDIPEVEKYPTLIEPMLVAYFKDPQLDPNQVKGVEYRTADDNPSYIDIWGADDRGLWVRDFKCKMHATGYQIAEAITEYRTSWQLAHYVDALHRAIGEMPYKTEISLIIASPKTQHVVLTYEVDKEWMRWWRKSAERLWAEIDEARAWVEANHPNIEQAREHFGMAPDHNEGRYRCQYLQLCTFGGGEPDLSTGFITVKERK